jgi:hypothetical protein
MSTVQLDKLALGQMASGHLNLDLSEKVSWDEFPAYVEGFRQICGGVITEKADAPDARLWGITINDVDLRLVYDDYPQMISLESSSDAGDQEIRRLHEKLSEKRVP